MLDLDKKVGNRVCANTKGGDSKIILEKSDKKSKPYSIEIKTGCKNEPKKSQRFCEECLSKFAVCNRDSKDVMFLESLHPLQSKKVGSSRELNNERARLCNK